MNIVTNDISKENNVKNKPELRDKIQNWILNHQNVIDFPNKITFSVLEKRVTSENVFCTKTDYKFFFMNYIKI